MLGQAITFTLSFFSKPLVVLEVCLGSLSCCNTTLRPSLRRLSARGQRRTQRLALENRRMSAASIAEGLEGVGGQPVSAQTIRRTLHHTGLHGCRPRRKPILKMMHKKPHKKFAEDKQTTDMDYCNHVLWSDETKIHLFGSDGVKSVERQPGEEYKDKCVLPIVKHGGWSVMVWGCMSAASTGDLQFIEF